MLLCLTPDTPLTCALQHLTRERRDAVKQRTRYNNQLKALLKESYPLFLRICEEDLFASLADELLLACPSFEALNQTEPEVLRQFYLNHGCWKTDLIAWRVKYIREAQPLTTDPAVIQSTSLRAKMLATFLLDLDRSMKAYDATIADLFAQHEDAPILVIFPGTGPTLALRLMTAFGTKRNRCADAIEVQSKMGISPVKKERRKTKMIVWRVMCSKFLTFPRILSGVTELSGTSLLIGNHVKSLFESDFTHFRS